MVLLASDFCKSRFLKAGDLGGEKKFRIKSVSVEEIGDKKERKPVLWFTNDERGLVLNKTNLHTLSGAFGDNMEAWPGKIIAMFETMVDMRGKLVSALRVRIPASKQATAGNGQAAAPARPKSTLDVFGGETEPPAKPVAKPSLTDELDDEIGF
jgi:hypothetical protein